MKVFMLANVPKAWVVTMKGPYVPMKIVGEREVPKEEIDWNDEDLEKIMINNKAISMLQCALNPTEYHRVSGCDTAKEMWDMLEVTHEGTSQVKESKIIKLIYMYELFKMKPEESIQDMYTRLNDIITNLKALGKVYPPQEVLEDLIGKLMTYETEVQVDGGVEVVEKKKKDVAFKATKQKEESEDDASNDESSNEENITKLVSKEVKKYMKKSLKGKSPRRNKEIHYSRGRQCSDDDDDDRGKPSKKHIKCYECNKTGHYKNECSQLKKSERKDKKSMKKKAFVATWSDDETSSTESESSLENGVANLCFMAQEDNYNDEEASRVGSSLFTAGSTKNPRVFFLYTTTGSRFTAGSTQKNRESSLSRPQPALGSLAYSNRRRPDSDQLYSRLFLSLMASRRGRSKRKQIGSSSADGQAQEEGNVVDNALFVDDDAINRYNFVKNLAMLPCNCVKFSQFPQGDMLVEQIFRDIGKRLNLGRFIYRNLIKNYSSNMGLPHGALITRLVKRNNIDLTHFMLGKAQSGTTLNKASSKKMQVVFRSGSWMKKGDQAMEQQDDEEEGGIDQEMAKQGEEKHADDNPRPFQAFMQRTNRETMELMIFEM
ncbi:hypothetical protein SLEP1_g26226 [Rubroshorea leprosula]|uniref:CCHC-type domain-containing protein n=1 Tax=Rubroshorea leprosula TaxID=152421 RepID=A0AAV5JYT2_9ROSI|nr:hypothetical protein SLEP1_g26226 [Rubroshorea leprosula]